MWYPAAMEPASASPPSPAAPPTEPPPPPPPGAPGWPVALGAVAIAFGGFGILGSVLGVLAVAFQDEYLGLFGSAIPDEAAEQIAARSPHPALSGGLQVASLLVAAMLLVAGVRLLRRRRSGASLLRVWAVVKMPLVLVGAVIGAQTGTASFQAGAGGGPPPGAMASFMVMSILVAVVWGWALPVFSLVWLRREKVKKDMAGWLL